MDPDGSTGACRQANLARERRDYRAKDSMKSDDMTIDGKIAQEKFDHFLMVMDDQLDWLSVEAKQHGIKLELKSNVFQKLENLFDLMASGKDKDYISKLVVTFARYLGETVTRTTVGNEPCLSTTNIT